MIDQTFVKKLMLCCGGGQWLYIGQDPARMLMEFLVAGIDARAVVLETSELHSCLACFPGRGYPGTVLDTLDLGSDNWQPESIFCFHQIDSLEDEAAAAYLNRLYKLTRRNVILFLTSTSINGQLRNRSWWENCCLGAGFRVHPRSYHVVPYEAREHEGNSVTVLLEKVPESALAAYPVRVLATNHILHMDMLRETGRRGDAHCIRYHMAAQYIRPGDVVLDAACGLGYGSHILYQNSLAKSVLGVDNSHAAIVYAEANYGLDEVVHFRGGDAQDLSFLPDNSVDFITGFETIEHVPLPEKYLAELRRVLRPSGRLMICAPNDWTDETGRDPNPHHLHVYTWKRLIAECRDFFLLEKGFSQVAGGAMKCHHSPRKWAEVGLHAIPEVESEWTVLLCMKDPVDGKGIPYKETTWRIPDAAGFNVSAFARDYDNPWLAKGMVVIGMRSQSSDNLRSMQERVLEVASHTSVDYGAALCGLVYSWLDVNSIDDIEYEFILAQIKEYTAIANPTPHQLRWQVSLLYAGAQLAKMRGRLMDAERLYSDCAEKDVVPYSPLLGNKTLDSLYWLAMAALGRKDLSEARLHLLRSVEEAKRLTAGSWINICGSTEDPLPFGLAELAQLLDKASRAAYMLASLDDYSRRPAVFFVEAKGYYERVLFWKEIDLCILRKAVQELAREVARQDAHAQELAHEIARQDAHAQELAREVGRQIDRNQRLEDQLKGMTFVRRFLKRGLEKLMRRLGLSS